MAIDFDLKAVRCFVALVEEGNFSRAAERMSITQPSFSNQIRKLEHQIGTPLFVRSTRQVSLTETGAALLEPARRLVTEANHFANEMSSRSPRLSPIVTIGMPLYLYSLPEHDILVAGLTNEIPDVPLRVDNGFNHNLIDRLQRGVMDFALLLGVPVSNWKLKTAGHDNGELEFPDDLIRKTIRREPICLAVPAEHPLARYPIIPQNALAGHALAILSPIHGSAIYVPLTYYLQQSGARFFEPAEAHGLALERFCRTQRIPAVSVSWFRNENDGDVVYRTLEGLELSTELALVRTNSEWRSANARRAWQHALALLHKDQSY